MLGIGMQEILIILVVALIILGPKKLPEMARALGRAFAEFQRVAQDLSSTVSLDEEPEDEWEPDHVDLPPPPGSSEEEAELAKAGEAEPAESEEAELAESDEAEESAAERTS